MHWYVNVIKQYAVFQGRARRQEFWMFFLFNLVITLILQRLDIFLLGPANHVQILTLIYTLAVLIPYLALTVRRLHDTNRSGWWVLVSFIPVIGYFTILIFCAFEGNKGANQYGPDPKGGNDSMIF